MEDEMTKNDVIICELIKQLQRNAQDYRDWKCEESLYSMSALMNQIVVLAKEDLFPQKEAKDEKKFS
jgi:hypothetical protein